MKTWCRLISRIVIVFSAFFLMGSYAYSQALTIGPVDPGPYTPGSTIAAPFTIAPNSCITQGNVFQLYLSDASGSFATERLIGTYTGFYSTYVNGIIPAGTPAGTNYMVRVKSTTPAFISTVSAPFEIKAGAAVTAGVVSTYLNTTNRETFGTCTTRDNFELALSNSSTATATVSANITNELTKATTNLNLDAPKTFTAQLAHYTIFAKATMPDGTVGTKAYLIINNQAVTAFATLNNNPVCLPLANYQFAVDLTQSGILNNFPGDRYVINWGDGTTTTYTFCEIQQAGGRVSHDYTRSSCGRSSTTSSGTVFNAFDVTIRVANDFCGNLGSPLLAYAKVVVKPENRFTFSTPACINTDITFVNTSLLGENPNTTSASCTPNTVTYNWYVDGVLIEANKPRSFNFVYKFLTKGRHVIRLTSVSSGSCDADPVEQEICIQDPPKPIFTLPATTVCAPNTLAPVNISEIDNTCNATATYLWTITPAVPFVGGTSATSKDPIFNFTTAGTYSVTLSVTSGTCGPVLSAPQTVTVQGADAGQDQLGICSGNQTTLAGNNNLSGIWSQVSGPAVTIDAPSQYNTTVTGISAGNSYTFRWTITGGTCPGSWDDVIVSYPAAITNNISTSNLTICSGQTITITGDVPTGGNGIFAFQWQSSTDGNTWVNLTGATSKDLTVTPGGTIYYRRQVTSGCVSNSNPLQINVLPPIANNTISANQSICSGNTVAPLTGTVPTGGDGTTFTYQWQSSLNGTTWTDVSGATAIDYTPPQPTATILYRRLVTSGACAGAPQNVSNTVTITVNQAAKAEINFVNDKGCAPFALTASNVTAGLYPGRNSTFTWFADNVQIGTGATFPGYTIASDNSSVVIKLVVTSGANCGSDEISHTFSTYQTVTPNFTQNVTEGCGPLSLTVVNTSSSQTAGTFRWDFGNGTTSNLATPPTVIYQPDPLGRDITYTIKLDVTTACGTVSKTSTVLVKAAPISVFSPDKTAGCSPFTATFSNTSPGNYTSFIYDFGDGTTLTTTDKNSVTHTYTTIAVKDYIVKMTAINDCGVNQSQYTIRVSPNNITPELVVNANELRGCAPLKVSFFNNSKGASTFYYDFGDGSSALTSTAPEMIEHTFTKPGSYLVTLYASNDCSNAYTTETIVVLDQPTVAFTSDITTGCTGTVIKFKNNSKNAVSYLWDFGDGTTSTEFEPQHTYTGAAMNYTVSLTARNLQGCSNTSVIPNYINLVTPPQPIFTVLPGNELSIPNFTFSFRDASLNGAGSWEWSFGDGTTSRLQNPTHTYANVGDYLVTLKIFNKEGCSATTVQTVRILDVPGFLYVPNSFMPGSQKSELQTFKAKGRGIDNWTMTVFNKWGQVLWETTKLNDGAPLEGWDGRYNGQEQPQGVYFWKIEVKFINGGEWKGMTYDSSPPKKTGNIYLIR
ncbi:PKD domain-containing protein [Pedobacter aquatilis]|uniref:PKD domain-containing protein n=1 Tax=Pedobacter aquatilis TaxID=351343 RepID=UPI0029311E2F|nr:PKD domain-containing protein [Pedobacter aquatilis]